MPQQAANEVVAAFVMESLKNQGRWPSQREVQRQFGGSFSTIAKDLEHVAKSIGTGALIGAKEIPSAAVRPVLALLQAIRAEEAAKIAPEIESARSLIADLEGKLDEAKRAHIGAESSLRSVIEDSRRAAEAWGTERAALQDAMRTAEAVRSEASRRAEDLEQARLDAARQCKEALARAGIAEERCAELESELHAASERHQATLAAMAEMKTAHADALTDARGAIETLEHAVASEAHQRSTAEAKVQSLEDTVREMTATIKDLQSMASAAELRLSRANLELEGTARRLAEAETEAATLKGETSVLRAELGTVRTQFSQELAKMAQALQSKGHPNDRSRKKPRGADAT